MRIETRARAYQRTSTRPPRAQDVGIARTGFFLHMKPKDVAVFRWDPDAEDRRGAPKPRSEADVAVTACMRTPF